MKGFASSVEVIFCSLTWDPAVEAGIVPGWEAVPTPAPSGAGGGRDGAGVVPLNPVTPPTWHESPVASLRGRRRKAGKFIWGWGWSRGYKNCTQVIIQFTRNWRWGKELAATGPRSPAKRWEVPAVPSVLPLAPGMNSWTRRYLSVQTNLLKITWEKAGVSFHN